MEGVAYHCTENTAQVPGVVAVRHISDRILSVVQASIQDGQANVEDVSLKLWYRNKSVFWKHRLLKIRMQRAILVLHGVFKSLIEGLQSSARHYNIKIWPQQTLKIRTHRASQNLESVDLVLYQGKAT